VQIQMKVQVLQVKEVGDKKQYRVAKCVVWNDDNAEMVEVFLGESLKDERKGEYTGVFVPSERERALTLRLEKVLPAMAAPASKAA
jgi:hypothetical protein